MAASLVKMMSRLCLSQQAGVTKHGMLSSSKLAVTKDQERSYSVLQAQRRLLLSESQKKSDNSRNLPIPTALSVTARSVTYEIKQWREHRVVNRFYRLHWGGWIRTKGGRFRSLYRKTPQIRWYLKQHIFCDRSQCQRLDRLILPQWKKPKHFADSPYEPYHQRTNHPDFPNHRKFYP